MNIIFIVMSQEEYVRSVLAPFTIKPCITWIKKCRSYKNKTFTHFTRLQINLIFFKTCNYRCCYWCHSTYLHVCYTIGNFNQELIQELTLLFIALSEIAKPPQKLDIEAIVYYQKITSINQPTRDGKYCYQHQHLHPEKRLTVCKNN